MYTHRLVWVFIFTSAFLFAQDHDFLATNRLVDKSSNEIEQKISYIKNIKNQLGAYREGLRASSSNGYQPLFTLAKHRSPEQSDYAQNLEQKLESYENELRASKEKEAQAKEIDNKITSVFSWVKSKINDLYDKIMSSIKKHDDEIQEQKNEIGNIKEALSNTVSKKDIEARFERFNETFFPKTPKRGSKVVIYRQPINSIKKLINDNVKLSENKIKNDIQTKIAFLEKKLVSNPEEQEKLNQLVDLKVSTTEKKIRYEMGAKIEQLQNQIAVLNNAVDNVNTMQASKIRVTSTSQASAPVNTDKKVKKSDIEKMIKLAVAQRLQNEEAIADSTVSKPSSVSNTQTSTSRTPSRVVTYYD